MRKLAITVLGAGALALGACGEKGAAPAPEATSAAADETPENAPGIALTDAVVKLPMASGRPGSAYFTLSQGNGAARKIAGVFVEGVGRAEMHESKMDNGVATMAPVKDVPIEPGKTVEFKPGGLHVMLYDFGTGLTAGGETELTVTLDNGDKISAKAKVVGAMDGETDHHM
jgi:copper(I)-binding protein